MGDKALLLKAKLGLLVRNQSTYDYRV